MHKNLKNLIYLLLHFNLNTYFFKTFFSNFQIVFFLQVYQG